MLGVPVPAGSSILLITSLLSLSLLFVSIIPTRVYGFSVLPHHHNHHHDSFHSAPVVKTHRAPSHVSSTTSLYISNLFQGNSNQTPQLPKDVKEAVSSCRAAVQKGLEDKLSRMDIEFPVGTKFGVEKKQSNKKKGGNLVAALSSEDSSTSSSSGITRDILDMSDRELARLFVEMFQPLGGNHISVVFHDSYLAQTAQQAWKNDLGAQCNILSMQKGKKMKSAMKEIRSQAKGMAGAGMGGGRKSKKKAFATKMNEEFDDASSGPFKLPDGCELAIFVAPTAKDLITIKNVCQNVGMGTLVILLNARLSLVDNFGSDENEKFFQNEFESTFYLSVAPQQAAPGCLMHRAYPNDWIVARKPKAGAPKTIGTFANKPTDQDCADAYSSIEIGNFEQVADNVLENVSSWLK